MGRLLMVIPHDVMCRGVVPVLQQPLSVGYQGYSSQRWSVSLWPTPGPSECSQIDVELGLSQPSAVVQNA